MGLIKYGKTIKELTPDDAIKKVFLEREDIKRLLPEEQEKQWLKELIDINEVQEWLVKKLSDDEIK